MKKMVVLAKDWRSAREAIRSFGKTPAQCIYADSPERLKGLRDVGFIYANNWKDHPQAAEIQLEVALITARQKDSQC